MAALINYWRVVSFFASPWLPLLLLTASVGCVEFQYTGKGYKCGKPPNDNTFRIAVLVPYAPCPKNSQKEAVVASHEVHNVHNKAHKPGFLAPAEDIALATIERLKANGKLVHLANYTVKLYWADTHGDIKVALDLIFRYLLDIPVHGFLGPICTFPLASATRILGNRFERSVVSYGGMNYDMGNKNDYPLLTRMLGSFSAVTRLFDLAFQQYGWFPHPGMVIGMLAFANDPDIAIGVISSFRGDTGYKVEGLMMKKYDDIEERLESISKVTRSKCNLRGCRLNSTNN